MKTKRVVFCLLLILFGFCLYAADTIVCYSAIYHAVKNPYFDKQGKAEVGSLSIYVDRSRDSDGKIKPATEDETAYLSALYFRNGTPSQNKVNLIFEDSQDSPNPTKYEAHLVSQVTMINNSSVPDDSITDLHDNVITGVQNEKFLHILPEYYRSSPNNNYTRAIWTPGYPNQPGEQYVMTVTFYLQIIGKTPGREFRGENMIILNDGSSLSDFETLCVCHNYDIKRFFGSKVPTDQIGGNLDSFIDDSNPIRFGNPREFDNSIYSVIEFTERQVDFNSVPIDGTVIGNFNIMLYGDRIERDIIIAREHNWQPRTYSLIYKFDGMNEANPLDNTEFRVCRKVGSGIDEVNYATYNLLLSTPSRTVMIKRNKSFLWRGLLGGQSNLFSTSNTAELKITNFDNTNARASGQYVDVITIEITPVEMY